MKHLFCGRTIGHWKKSKKSLKTQRHNRYNNRMLTRLSISNIVLIEHLDLDFGAGLNILTGETGAGKSILMDSLALALGARSDAALVRSGAVSAAVVAEFDNAPRAARTILDDAGIELDSFSFFSRSIMYLHYWTVQHT